MEQEKRATLLLALFLIFLGVLLLVLNILPGWSALVTWPIIFFVFAAGFMIPPLMFPRLRSGLAALFIPGAVLLTMGILFTYNVLSQDWSAWAYAWLLISSGAGGGLALASWYGRWGKGVTLTGIWIMAAGSALFAFFGFIFGGTLMKTLAAILLILLGLGLVFQSVLRK